jgi:acyl-CoA thioester hydrolase
VRYTHHVRYSECDMQKVVHNSLYLRWCDDLADIYFRDLVPGLDAGTWDAMVKAATITWQAPAHFRDAVDIDITISRFGTTSFDVTYHGSRDGEALFEASMTYVCVDVGTTEKRPVPDELREAVARSG